MSVNSGILRNPTSISDMQKQRNKRKFSIVSDDGFSSLSKCQVKTFYCDIPGQLSGDKACIIYDINTHDFEKIGNGPVIHSSSNIRSGTKFISSNRNLGGPDISGSTKDFLDRTSSNSHIDYIVISCNIFKNSVSNVEKNHSQSLEKQSSSVASNVSSQNSTSFQTPFIVIPLNSKQVEIALDDSNAIHQNNETESNEIVFENVTSQNNETDSQFNDYENTANIDNMSASDNDEDLPYYSDLNEMISELRSTQSNIIMTD